MLWQEGQTSVLVVGATAAVLLVLALAARAWLAALLVVLAAAVAVAVLAWTYRLPAELPEVPQRDDVLLAPAHGEVVALAFDAASNLFTLEIQPRWDDPRHQFYPLPAKVMEHRGAIGTDQHTVTLRTSRGADVLLVQQGPAAISNGAAVGSRVQGGERVGMIHPAWGIHFEAPPRTAVKVLFRAAHFAPAVKLGDRVVARQTALAYALGTNNMDKV